MDSPRSEAAAAPPVWQAAESGSLDWASWDGEHVLYHRPSGRTHLVNAATYELITAVLVSPRTLPEVEQELARRGLAAEGEEALGMLLRLEELGLVSAR